MDVKMPGWGPALRGHVPNDGVEMTLKLEFLFACCGTASKFIFARVKLILGFLGFNSLRISGH